MTQLIHSFIFSTITIRNLLITDTGYVSDRMKGMIQGSDAFMF